MLDLSYFNGKTILITGATGLIGKNIIYSLLKWNKNSKNPIKIIALVRNKEKARKIFEGYESDELDVRVCDVCNMDYTDMGINYVIHGASQTSSRAFVNAPVETIMTSLIGTKNVLDLAKSNHVEGFVYLSSMEVYGHPTTDEKIFEDNATNLNCMKVRSCYPESKRMCENLCTSYAAEFGIPAKVVRLTQTFGPGVLYHDERVFAEFARCIIEEKDIVLNTKGETKRCYLYIEDAVKAILTVLYKGEAGEAYNAANESTYCSIYEMAIMASALCNKKKIRVIIREKTDSSKLGYAPTLKMNLDTSKLEKLGWKAEVGLKEMFIKMIKDMCR